MEALDLNGILTKLAPHYGGSSLSVPTKGFSSSHPIREILEPIEVQQLEEAARGDKVYVRLNRGPLGRRCGHLDHEVAALHTRGQSVRAIGLQLNLSRGAVRSAIARLYS